MHSERQLLNYWATSLADESNVCGRREPEIRATASQIRHDIRHEVATIVLLADVVGASPEISPSTRWRIEQLGNEAKWLEELLHAYDDVVVGSRERAAWSAPVSPLRLDLLAAEVLAGLRLVSMAEVTLNATPTWICANRLASWRALRNVMQNAFRAAGPAGRLSIHVGVDGREAFVQIDDDGPGFGHGPSGIASMGLGIVQNYATERGGMVEIRGSELGGCCVRVLIPVLMTSSDRNATSAD